MEYNDAIRNSLHGQKIRAIIFKNNCDVPAAKHLEDLHILLLVNTSFIKSYKANLEKTPKFSISNMRCAYRILNRYLHENIISADHFILRYLLEGLTFASVIMEIDLVNEDVSHDTQ